MLELTRYATSSVWPSSADCHGEEVHHPHGTVANPRHLRNVASSSDSSRESGPHVTFASFFGDTGITASDELVNMAAGADLKPSGGGGLMSPVE